MQEREDASLIQRCQEGSSGAFDELVLKYHKKVFNIAYRLLNNNYDEANDIAQEVFVRAWRAIKRFRQESGVFTWLYRITVNLCKNRFKVLNRERKRLRSIDSPISTIEGEVRPQIAEDKPLPSEILMSKEDEELVQGALASLDSELREALVLRDIEGLNYEEIARLLEINIGTVKSRLHRGRIALREKLKLKGVLK